jgi:hypothetical protein
MNCLFGYRIRIPRSWIGHSAAHDMALFRFDPQQEPQISPFSAGQSRFAPPVLQERHWDLFMLFFRLCRLNKIILVSAQV